MARAPVFRPVLDPMTSTDKWASSQHELHSVARQYDGKKHIEAPTTNTTPPMAAKGQASRPTLTPQHTFIPVESQHRVQRQGRHHKSYPHRSIHGEHDIHFSLTLHHVPTLPHAGKGSAIAAPPITDRRIRRSFSYIRRSLSRDSAALRARGRRNRFFFMTESHFLQTRASVRAENSSLSTA